MVDEELIALLNGTRRDPVVVCRIPPELAQLIGAFTTTVWLSRDTVVKQEVKHHHEQLDFYRRAPDIILGGFRRVQPPNNLLLIKHYREHKLRSFRAVIKATLDGREIYLTSVHPLQKGDVRAAYSRSISIEEWKAQREVGPPRNPT